jgi:hypothetical protein
MNPFILGSLAASVISAVAAIAAAYYAGKSPSKEELERVERNTAESTKAIEAVRNHISKMEEHLCEQNKRESLNNLAARVYISVTARDRIVDPLTLVFTLKDPTVSLRRIDLVNDLDMLSGTADCSSLDPLCFTAVLEEKVAQQWFDSAGSKQPVNQKQLVIRAHLLIDGREALRTFSVNMYRVAQPGQEQGSSEGVFTLSGNC